MNPLAFVLRQFRRELRASEVRVLILALVVAVGAVSTVDLFADRVGQALVRQASDMLAADLVVHSSTGFDDALEELARNRGLRTGRAMTFRSVVMAGDEPLLAELKAVNSGYPLRGSLRVAPEPFAPDRQTDAIPEPGTVWVEGRLLQAMGLEVGDLLSVGVSELKIDQVITLEPDRGLELFNIGPRILLNLEDIPATQLVQPASRVSWILLLAGEPDAVGAYAKEIADRLTANEHTHGARDARPQMRLALDRAERFLSLAALTSVLLAGVAVGMAARRHAQRHADYSAILRCLGATSRTILQGYLIKLGIVGVVASLAGCLLGFGMQYLVGEILADLYGGALPQPGLRGMWIGATTGMITLFGFALPPLLQLSRVSPLRVLRRDLGLPPVSALSAYALAAGTMIALLLWHTADVTLTLYTLAGTVATILLLGGFALLLIRSLRPLRQRVGTSWRFGLANIARRGRTTLVQLIAFGLGIMVLLLLTSVRTDLLDTWRQAIPDNAPNHFLINIQPEQVAPLADQLRDRGIEQAAIYPMIRARLVSINGDNARDRDYGGERANRLARRSFNLSLAGELPLGNTLVDGEWWPSAGETRAFSFEEGIAESLGVKVGDRIRFQVAEQEIEAVITNLRKVDWDSFRPNFFVIGSPATLADLPATHITSIHLAAAQKPLLGDLVRTFPNITVLDVDAIMQHVNAIIERVSLAIELVFGFTLAAGLVILYAAVGNTLDERRFEGALMRTLGGNRQTLIRSLLAEFAVLGGSAGLLAGLVASVTAFVVGNRILELPYAINPTLWLIGAVGGALGISLAGLLATRGVLDHPPLAVLNRA